jgi:galactonate dehydratase
MPPALNPGLEMVAIDGFPLREPVSMGFELTEAAVKRYPFAGSRPMARVFHKDGSVAEW